jgi:hypothetical protein
MLPTVHLNGTSRAELQKQYEEAHTAIEHAITALAHAAPNGRDYYPQGAHAYGIAAREHESRVERLRNVQAELYAIYESVAG